MKEGSTNQKPIVLMLYLDKPIAGMVCEVLKEEGYATRATSRVAEALSVVDGNDGKYLVLMDNFHFSKEAHRFLSELHNRPELRGRVKVIGMAAVINWTLGDKVLLGEIDERLPMPFTVDQLIEQVETTSRQLLGEM